MTLDGWGAVFGTETVIDSFEGRFREQFALGSMKRSFRETPPKIQYDHGRHPMVGSIPIAALRSVAEEVHPEFAPNGGAHIIGRVFDNWLAAPVRDAIAEGAIDGMSIRFSVVREQWQHPDGKTIRDEDQLVTELMKAYRGDIPDEELLLRTIKEAKVPEMGPVMWPAYDTTSVSVRSRRIIDLGRLHEPEQRKLLAEAVLIADTVEQEQEEGSQPTTGDEPVEQRQPEPATGAQQSTPVGERPSKPRTLTDRQLRLRNQRDRLLHLRQIGERPA